MKAKLICNIAYQIGRIDDRLYGSFVEHMGRVVYSGIYEPDHPTADASGFRRDVLELVKELSVSCVRYPGGNFVSGYDWMDGVGDPQSRPRRLELAWRSVETNAFGTNEFMDWAQKAEIAPIFTVNLGTKGVENAVSLLEYCNIPSGTKYSDLRRAHGQEKPHGISMWCLGNEMDGYWQIGHKSAEEYGRLAAQTGCAMKLVDPSIELIACGSSKSDMPSFPDWDMTVLDHVYDVADYISVHQYYGGQEKGTAAFLAQALDMDRYIQTIRGAILLTQQRKRSKHLVYISVDEWGVWANPADTVNQELAAKPWQIAPAISEQIYTLEDALLFASMLMVMMRNCDIIKIGCQALLTNISACIMTERGGECWKQTTFYPFQYMATFGHGLMLNTAVLSDCYSCEEFAEVPFLDAAAVYDDKKNEVVIFAVNRSVDQPMDLEIPLQGFGQICAGEHVVLTSDNVKQTNLVDHNAVVPVNVQDLKIEDSTCSAKLPAMSFHMIRLTLKS